jgi:hypothetical protein
MNSPAVLSRIQVLHLKGSYFLITHAGEFITFPPQDERGLAKGAFNLKYDRHKKNPLVNAT